MYESSVTASFGNLICLNSQLAYAIRTGGQYKIHKRVTFGWELDLVPSTGQSTTRLCTQLP